MSHQDIIRIKNAVFYAYHGVVRDEQNLGGKFEVDAELSCDLSAAEEHDSLKQTVDYEKVYAFMKDLVLGKKYYLIEALGNTIANGVLAQFPTVSKVLVRVRKHSPPVKGVVDYVEAEVERHRT